MLGPLGKSLGIAKKSPMPMMGDDEEEGEDYASPEEEAPEEEAESTLPAGFDSAFEEFQAAPTAQGLYDMIKMCESGGDDKPGGLALILGGKGKK